jgi:hypothetical protein
MQTKSARQIQSDLHIIRLAYTKRRDSLNIPLIPDFRETIPYLISAALVISIIGFIVAILFT